MKIFSSLSIRMFANFAFAFVMIPASAVADQVSVVGSYAGCGVTANQETRKIVFHLVSLPTGLGQDDQVLTGAFNAVEKGGDFKNGLATFFPKVHFDASTGKVAMNVNVAPRKDFGMIIDAVTATLMPDGSMKGEFRTNSFEGNGRLKAITWVAHRIPEGADPSAMQLCP